VKNQYKEKVLDFYKVQAFDNQTLDFDKLSIQEDQDQEQTENKRQINTDKAVSGS
jgi:hypothetical protein